ncbi:hypothetical protein [Kiloniella sp.]|uniref:hypothetical protein n=1 Tax=Kiloniella sp. TaxID=1938587 RepID=UPI003A8DE5A2
MTTQLHSTNSISLRPPQQVMKLDRLGSFHQTRLSFMRAVMRRLKRDNWTFECPVWRINAQGEGVAVYLAKGPERSYSLVCFAHDLDPAKRSDRVIAEAWDTTFALYDGVIGEDDIERLSQNVPKQEAGRCLESELVLSRANKSVRLFEYVVSELAAGRQPDQTELNKVGYLMRTTAVYGNGKLGMADRDRIANRSEMLGPFRAEMLAVWLIRNFVSDYVEQMAAYRSPEAAVKLEPEVRRSLGVGNSTGLGMAPFLVNHPILLHSWIHARESALACIRALPTMTSAARHHYEVYLESAHLSLDRWFTVDERQAERVTVLRRDLEKLSALSLDTFSDDDLPWDKLYRWGEAELSLEGQELLVSLLLEPHAEIVDAYASVMYAEENDNFRINGSQSVADLLVALEEHYSWALSVDYDRHPNSVFFWYVSEEKLEPRLGSRGEEPGDNLEQPLSIGRDAARLYKDLLNAQTDQKIGSFLIDYPEHRLIARRVQLTQRYPYAEIQDNLIGEDLLPVDLLRCKLSFFGATRFDPRSDRWVRITMFQNAPYPHELATMDEDNWAYPMDISPVDINKEGGL